LTIQQVLLGNAWEANYATWNPSDKSPEVSLSGGDLLATSTSANNESVRSTLGKSSGKWYWEITITTGTFGHIGVATSSEPLDNLPIGTTTAGWAYRSDAVKVTNNTATVYGATYTTNDVIGVALDMDNGTLTFYKNGASQGQAFTGLTGTVYPAGTVGAGTTAVQTANFGASALTPPAGFAAGMYQ
jgi:hypothetical protein